MTVQELRDDLQQYDGSLLVAVTPHPGGFCFALQAVSLWERATITTRDTSLAFVSRATAPQAVVLALFPPHVCRAGGTHAA